ncbi:MAG: BatD family protein [Sedimenticola sp.]
MQPLKSQSAVSRWRLITSLFLMLMLLLGNAHAAVNASLDRQLIREGETVQLTLEVAGQGGSQPDTSPLERDFELLGTSSSSHLSIVNGRADSRTTWTLTLSPKRTGELTIPPLTMGAHTTPALKLKVEVASAPSADEQPDIFIESQALPENPYVQAQLLLRVRLFHAVNINQGTLSDPEVEHALIQRIGKDRRFKTYKGGRQYQMVERLYALFPQSSGQLEIAAPVFNGQVPDRSRQRSRSGRVFGNDPFSSLFSTTKQVRVRGKILTVAVRPQPVAAGGKHWLPSTEVQLSEEWSEAGDKLRVGDPLTRTVTLTARGLTAAQLPDLAQAAADGFSSYPDKPELTTDAEGEQGVIGKRLQHIAYIPTRPGLLELPEVVVEWWNTESDRLERLVLPRRRLQVMPAAGAEVERPAPIEQSATLTPPPAIAAPPTGVSTATTIVAPGYWPWIAAAFALAWLITLLLWWRSRVSTPPSTESDKGEMPDSATARNRFKTACQRNDSTAARATLIAWAAAEWPEAPPSGLDGVAEHFDTEETQELILQLDRHLYREGSDWEGARLLAAVKKLPVINAHVKGDSGKLPPLYPAKSAR